MGDICNVYLKLYLPLRERSSVAVGAKVESQPFGGQNKSGTGFKAGGPHYLLRFMTERTTTVNTTAFGGNVELLNG